jgi:hypothetical protein
MKPPARRRGKPVAKDRADLPAPRPLVWMGSSKDDISAMPVEVKASFGLRLYELQVGRTPLEKPLIQLGGWVYELRDSFDGNAYRVVYVINFGVHASWMRGRIDHGGHGFPTGQRQRFRRSRFHPGPS